MARSVFIVDDEQSIRHSLTGILEDEGYDVSSVSSGKEALERLRDRRPDVMLLDIWMPEMDGIEVIRLVKEEFPDQVVVMMSGHGTIETAVKALKFGAYDFLEKPISLERLLIVIRNSIQSGDLVRENQVLKKQAYRGKQMVGESEGIRQVQELIKRVAPTTGSVLITGENGTGKELVAVGIHALSARAQKPFIEVNCAAIPEELIESELFGHERGAFTGATQLRRGKFELANGGTLFLDEIGDMSLKTQAKILRILQEQKYERVGGGQTYITDVRIIAATNKDLKQEIKSGNFREDLFYRLNVVPIVVPPLRERKSDIVLLANHFLRESCENYGKLQRTLSSEGERAVLAHSWPGNVRELKNFMDRVAILTHESDQGTPVKLSELDLGNASIEVSESVSGDDILGARSLKDARTEFEKEFIIQSLKDNDWNISKTAAVLGVERSHLHKKMKAFGIDTKD